MLWCMDKNGSGRKAHKATCGVVCKNKGESILRVHAYKNKGKLHFACL